MAVNTPIAIIAEAGEDISAASAPAAAPVAAPVAAAAPEAIAAPAVITTPAVEEAPEIPAGTPMITQTVREACLLYTSRCV